MERQHLSKPISLAAGEVTDGTYTAYIHAHNYNYHNFQILWDKGSAATLSLKIYGSIADDLGTGIGLEYHDLTKLLYNKSEITDSCLLLNADRYLGQMSWIKIVATISNSDSNTSLVIYHKS